MAAAAAAAAVSMKGLQLHVLSNQREYLLGQLLPRSLFGIRHRDKGSSAQQANCIDGPRSLLDTFRLLLLLLLVSHTLGWYPSRMSPKWMPNCTPAGTQPCCTARLVAVRLFR
jgi:hypothetical protein